MPFYQTSPLHPNVRYPPYRVTEDGDMDLMEKRITNLASAEMYDDAVNLADCLRIIEDWAVDTGAILQEEADDTSVYNFLNLRLIKVGDPFDDGDGVNLKYLKHYVDKKIEERTNELRKKIDPAVKKVLDTMYEAINREVEKKFKQYKNTVTPESASVEDKNEQH